MSKVKNAEPTQCELIVDYMQKHGTITQKEADRAFGITRLPSRINNLKNQGYIIYSRYIKVKNRFGKPRHVKQYSFTPFETTEVNNG